LIKAVIFDMDGVLVDSEPMHAKANVLALREFGLDKPYEYYLGFAGNTKYDMMQTIIDDYNLDTTAEILVETADKYNEIIYNEEGYTEINGVINLIHKLYNKGLLLAVASSSPYKDIESVLNYFKIYDCFKVILSGTDETIEPKPAPDIYNKALTLLNVAPTEAVAFEDTSVGIKSAKTCGIYCIAYANPNSGKQDYSLADRIIYNFDNVDEKTFIFTA